ncbi:MAG: hypothetical protein J6B98_05390 [Bacilli bacterium]|nr:hypothetical protein [Bacilli bacterium]
MNDYYIDDILRTFYANNKLNMPYQSKKNLKKLYKRNITHTSIMKRLLVYQTIFILCMLIFIPVSVVTASYIGKDIYEQIFEKTKNANLSEYEINVIVSSFINDPEAINGIKYMDELQINESGLTYGPDELGADLISVISDQGKLGYVYREELYKDNVTTIEDALSYQEEVKIINVYSSDGITVIGTFTIN